MSIEFQNRFEAITREELKDLPASCSLKLCPDQYVGTLASLGTGNGDFPDRQSLAFSTHAVPPAVLLLESPHKDEYPRDADPGPARGATGRMIRRSLPAILAEHISSESPLFLVNAVQFQCSLSEPTYVLRDDLFVRVWEDFGRDAFISRLRAVPGIERAFIINGCTKGNRPTRLPCLRELVEMAVFAALNRYSNLRVLHPSAWRSSRNRDYRWALRKEYSDHA